MKSVDTEIVLRRVQVTEPMKQTQTLEVRRKGRDGGRQTKRLALIGNRPRGRPPPGGTAPRRRDVRGHAPHRHRIQTTAVRSSNGARSVGVGTDVSLSVQRRWHDRSCVRPSRSHATGENCKDSSLHEAPAGPWSCGVARCLVPGLAGRPHAAVRL